MKKGLRYGWPLLCLAVLWLCCCKEQYDSPSDKSVEHLQVSYYLESNSKKDTSEKPVLTELFKDIQIANKENGGAEQDAERFALVREIAREYMKVEDYSKTITFLTEWVFKHPKDFYNAYYLFMTAYAYTKIDAYPIAELYFDEIVKNYPDLIVKGDSIHLLCLRQLINLSDRPEQKISYYEELITRFPDKVDLATMWFMLGQAYEKEGEWSKAIDAYTQFIVYYGAVIPGFPDAWSYAKQMIDFNKSSKDWTFESLPALLSTIEQALDAGNTQKLWQYRAKVNFFARSWVQGEDDEQAAEFNLSAFTNTSRLHYAKELSPDSNANEAYLKTWGWSQFTSIWYFYFRKVYFPLDPEIHGRWEWAGIYYGEKF
jgi:tetratricopeptide (TPR) repeat protein